MAAVTRLGRAEFVNYVNARHLIPDREGALQLYRTLRSYSSVLGLLCWPEGDETQGHVTFDLKGLKDLVDDDDRLLSLRELRDVGFVQVQLLVLVVSHYWKAGRLALIQPDDDIVADVVNDLPM